MMIRTKREGGQFYYEFMVEGKRYNGICEKCTTKREAEAYEKKMRAFVSKASDQKNVRTLIETFRDELTGGTKIQLAEAFELSLKKPHSRNASESFTSTKRNAFNDFTTFMADCYPEIKELASVLPQHAEEYISLLRKSGRYVKKMTYVRNGKKITRPVSGTPSSRTANLYQNVCAEVFSLLARDAGIVDNPFDMPKQKNDEETREAFTPAELRLIYDNLDDFTRPLFTVAIMTALREGDICTLQWSDINFKEKIIHRVMNKTGHPVEIPISDELAEYFLQQKESAGTSPYVFPVHAQMYDENRSGIPYRVKQFLEKIGIKTTRIPKGRTRAVSVKDLHSCRHTFCYYAGMRGIPLAVVQSIVGHMTPEMTKHYSAHATLEDKRRGMAAMSELLKLPTSAEPTVIDAAISEQSRDPERAELLHLVDVLPIEKIRELLEIAKKEQ